MVERGEEGAEDCFDRLPDSVLLLVFGKIADVKALGRCCVVSRRFLTLARQVDDVLVRVDCVVSGDDDRSSPDDYPPSNAFSSSTPCAGKPRGLFSDLLRLVLGGVARPLQAISQVFSGGGAGGSPRKAAAVSSSASEAASTDTSRHSPAEVLRNFKEIRRLRIELPAGELSVNDGVLLKWKAQFGSTLNNCVVLGASSVLSPEATPPSPPAADKGSDAVSPAGEEGEEGLLRRETNGGERIPESLFANGSLKLGVVWTISSLIAASARHYLLYPVITEHETLESLDLADADGQGLLRMDLRQLEELREQPITAAGSSQRTLVPSLQLMLWFAPHLELPGGTVLKGATLVAIRPCDDDSPASTSGAGEDTGWVSSAFEEPYATAAQQLLRRKLYRLEMNSF
ncbi:unnamed protein product [Spirodela intermedia]|uniref:F-box domain-containing protein n=1 Tax=Spirodela intermedia TaxID=51605 RepID=A0A7I8K9S6_SPIIN|nr:unnamed protein product [Spirodela intermedia]